MTELRRGLMAIHKDENNGQTEVLIISIDNESGTAVTHDEATGVITSLPLHQLKNKTDFTVKVVFGEEDCKALEEGEPYETNVYEFASQEAADAFKLGIAETCGWQQFQVL
ncbi:TPA: hypothetical protein ACGSTL_001262 [Vibrio parahaemolyticus]